MSESLPDSFDPQQPDLPTLAVDPDPHPEPEKGQGTRISPEDIDR